MDEMIDRVTHLISKEFVNKTSDMDGEIEIIIAGGTSIPNGFCERLQVSLSKCEFPFKVSGVRRSETPFYSVSQGACIRAQADYAKSK